MTANAMTWLSPILFAMVALLLAFLASWLGFPQFPLAVVAGVGAWIGVQQMIIARQKLNHDLFERRFAIYTATQDYLVTCLNKQGGTQEDTGKFYDATRAAPFLFNKEVNDFLGSGLIF